MPTFPSREWMDAYADLVAAHPDAEALTRALAGRYRFTITPAGGFGRTEDHDLVVLPGEVRAEAPAGGEGAPTLAVSADYERWKGLLTGQADFVMSFLMRRIKVDGDLGSLRQRVGDARPLLECLQRVPTTFPH